jgi:hypothetical protein
MWRVCAFVSCLAFVSACRGETNAIAFNRIIHGWTNYSTAFSATQDAQDAQDNGEYATVGTVYTPPFDVRPREFAAIVVWYGTDGQRLDFTSFSFQVGIWSGLHSFAANPRQADIAPFSFVRPTGGSTTVPDAITHGGRAAYELRFDLSSSNLVLNSCQTYVVGLFAKALQTQAGELFVPTAPFDGPSDVQAGNIVPFGWIYLMNAGGSTIYSGQLATELIVDTLGTLPKLEVARANAELRISWPAIAPCFQLEGTETLDAEWLPVDGQSELKNGKMVLQLSATNQARFFRLRQSSK